MGLIRALAWRSPAERRLLAEALLLLPAAATAIRLRSFPKVVGFGAVALGKATPVSVRALTSAVLAAARRMPFRALCFEQGLTVQRMLRRRGLDARLHYGIAPGEELKAHVWVSVDGEIVHGGESAAEFVEVGAWP